MPESDSNDPTAPLGLDVIHAEIAQTYTQLKTIEAPLPPAVSGSKSTEKSATPDKITGLRQQTIYHLSALGMSPQEIAKHLGVLPDRVKRLLSGSIAKGKVQELQQKLFLNDQKKVFLHLAPKAVKKVYKIMQKGKSEGTQLDAAKEILNRAYGKSVQQIEQTGGGIRDLYEQLDEMNRKLSAKDVITHSRPQVFDEAEIVGQSEGETAQGSEMKREENKELVLDDIDLMLGENQS